MASNFITASTITTASQSYIKSAADPILRKAGARAMLRHGLHMSDHCRVNSSKGLNPLFIGLHKRGNLKGDELTEAKEVVRDIRADVLDAVTALDILDGGVSILLHIPGQALARNVGVEGLTIDAIVPPRERTEAGKDFNKAVAILIQTFGCDIALPYLRRFHTRCKAEGVAIPSAPDMGRPMVMDETFIPEAETPGSVLVRCCCRPGRPTDLAKDFAIADIAALPRIGRPPRSLASTNATSSDNSGDESGRVVRGKSLTLRAPTTQALMIAPTVKAEAMEGTLNVDGPLNAIVSIGPRTDAVFDRFSFPPDEIRKIRRLVQSERSSRWEEVMRVGEFCYSFEQASTMFEALKVDLGIENSKAILKIHQSFLCGGAEGDSDMGFETVTLVQHFLNFVDELHSSDFKHSSTYLQIQGLALQVEYQWLSRGVAMSPSMAIPEATYYSPCEPASAQSGFDFGMAISMSIKDARGAVGAARPCLLISCPSGCFSAAFHPLRSRP
ncbi:hypothetical protein DXG01_003769 [Tephrocybe rancida]|nr:hypothetical protein DXG01_003769 [Tephrocybe rancida]